VATSAQSSSRLRFDDFEVNLCSGEVWKHGIRVRLQDQPFQVLRVLLERPEQIVTRDELKQTLWPADTFVDFDDGLNTAVKKIRELLGDSAERPRYIETIPRRGYRFVGPIAPPPPIEATVATPHSHPAPVLPPDEGAVPRNGYRPAAYVAVGVLALVVTLVGADVGGWRTRLMGHAAAPRIGSLAVLPLANLSRDPEQDYFADGMTETLIADLAQVGALRVISRTSAMHYKGTDKTLPQIARDLNVDAVIEGTVQRSGNRVRVTAKLIRVQTDDPVWAKVYERDSRDVLVMQSELAQAIVGEVKVQITPEERQHLAGARPINPEAHDAYLLGTYHCSKRNPASIGKGIEYFQQAIRIDPNYAQAYAGLAYAYLERGIWGGLGFTSASDQIRANTLRALELDGNLAEAHNLLGRIHFQLDWDWRATEAEYKRAIELNPNLAGAYVNYAYFLQAMRRQPEALAAVHRAVELDPLSAANICDEGRVFYRARRYEDAVARYQRALELDPNYVPALTRIVEAYEQLGKYDEARAYAQKYEQTSGDVRPGLQLIARIYARAGKRRQALEVLRTFEKNRPVSSEEYALARIYSALGDRDRAIAELEKMIQRRSDMPYIFVGPELDALRSDPRFQQLLRRANLPS
jgi:TolB-like protein/DNA-binding winged helix-turn-helix (wHTH) protein/Tfp pilus assembly protein PilF